jgi:hypothetical protein
MRAFFLSLIIVLSSVMLAHAATGTIDPDSAGNYTAAIENSALGSNNTINFGKFTTQSSRNITVSDTELRGFAWGEGTGWIVMNCADTTSGCSGTNGNFRVANDGDGNLSGYAWGETTGWIHFGPFTNSATEEVSINTNNGQFFGYAWAQNFGWIRFDCSGVGSCVETDWRPGSGGGGGGGSGTLPQCNDSSDNDGDGLVDFPNDLGCSWVGDNDEVNTPPPGICTDVLAVNVGGAAPCVYPNNPTTCSDITALNFGGALPCTYPSTPTDPTVCTDPLATNNGGALPCQYPDSPQALCADTNATNLGAPLPCQYPPAGCVGPDCGGGPTLTFCEQYPELCVTPDGPTTPQVITQSVGNVLTSFAGSIGQSIGSAVGIAAVGVGSIASYLILNPFSWFDIFLWISKLWSLILVWFGVKKKANPWGTVYDSVTKQPIDPAYVVLYDMTGKEVATSITDIEGRYGFAVPAGTYTIVANKTNYEFPSKKLSGKVEDELYRDLYFGGPITVTEEGGIIAKNIPLDQLAFDWNEYAKDEQRRLRHYHRRDVLIAQISNGMFIAGFIITGVSAIVAPSTFNIGMSVIYVIVALYKIFGISVYPKGSVADAATNIPVPFSVVRVYSTVTNQEILHRVADGMGRYYALTANGEYRVIVDRKNPDQSYTPVPVHDLVHVTKGYMKELFRI